MAGGFVFPLFFFSILYGYWATADVDISVRQIWVRAGITLLLFIILLWRVVEIKNKHDGEN